MKHIDKDEKKVVGRFAILMESLRLSLKDFCSQTGVSTQMWHRITTGSKPSFDSLLAIKTAFPKVNLNWLVAGEGTLFGITQAALSTVNEPNAPYGNERNNQCVDLEKKVVYLQNKCSQNTKDIQVLRATIDKYILT